MIKEYKGFTLQNPSGGWQDWRCTFIEQGEQRIRFGTFDELRVDVDSVTAGNPLPAKQLGWH